MSKHYDYVDPMTAMFIDEDDWDTLAEAIEAYGARAQLDLLQEEAAEVIAAVSHFRRGRELARDRLCEELADLIIMAAQAAMILGRDSIDCHVRAKLNRLHARVARHNKEHEL